MTKTERLLRDLIALPSVNPAFLPAGDPRAGEQRVGEFLAATAAAAGLDVEFRTALPGRPNLLARLTPAGRPLRRTLLAPHLDTVNGTDQQFVPHHVGNRIYGRGASDTKGSVAVMLGALCDLAASGARPTQTEIVFAGLVDEEHAQSGSRSLAAGGFKADLAIVGEPTSCSVVTAHKGSLWIQLETRGRSAHGATPHFGRNAVHEMARIVHLLETEYVTRLASRPHSVLGPATSSVGTIRGGTQANIVPNACQVLIDRRTLPGETARSVRREMLALLGQAGLRASFVSTKANDCLPMETSENIPLVRQFLRAARQLHGQGADYFCDASVLSDAGIPSIVFGPGDIAQAHTVDEWISLRSLEAAQSILVKFLQSLP